MCVFLLELGSVQDGVRDRYSVLFFITLNQAFTVVSAGAALFHQEKVFLMLEKMSLTRQGVVSRERSAGAYRVSSYFLGKTIAETPIILLFPTIHGAICLEPHLTISNYCVLADRPATRGSTLLHLLASLQLPYSGRTLVWPCHLRRHSNFRGWMSCFVTAPPFP